MRYNKKGLDRRWRILQQNPRDQIQSDWQEKKVLKSSKEDCFYP